MWGKGEEQYPEKQQLISSFTKNVLMGDVRKYRIDAVCFCSYSLPKHMLIFASGRCSKIRCRCLQEGHHGEG